jgi:Glycoside Hydrolase Family 113
VIAPRFALAAGLALTAVNGPTPPRHAPGTAPLPPLAAPPPPAPPAERERGVALGLFAEDVSFSYAKLLAEIVALGATHVALVVPLYQTDGASTELGLDTRFSPTLDTVAETARAAKRDGLEVMIFPIVRLSAPRAGEWRGTLAPRDRDAWFASYGEKMGDLAGIAAMTGAKRLVIGSELSTLDGDLDRWRPLVEKLRGVFGGKLVYSANWDHYQKAALFELVDEEGISGYFNLRDAKAPDDDATAEAGWRRLRQELEAWRSGRNAPFIFTELGYRSRAGATAAPWDEGPGGKADPDEQRRGFAAFRRAWAGSDALDGVYVWNWYGYGGPATTGYTPRGKPAETEVRALLEGL